MYQTPSKKDTISTGEVTSILLKNNNMNCKRTTYNTNSWRHLVDNSCLSIRYEPQTVCHIEHSIQYNFKKFMLTDSLSAKKLPKKLVFFGSFSKQSKVVLYSIIFRTFLEPN